jgi:hypothetical protein
LNVVDKAELVHEQHLEPLGLELPVQPVDGRQLLPAVGSPGRPEEEQDDLAANVFEPNGAPVERGQGERGRGAAGCWLDLPPRLVHSMKSMRQEADANCGG